MCVDMHSEQLSTLAENIASSGRTFKGIKYQVTEGNNQATVVHSGTRTQWDITPSIENLLYVRVLNQPIQHFQQTLYIREVKSVFDVAFAPRNQPIMVLFPCPH